MFGVEFKVDFSLSSFVNCVQGISFSYAFSCLSRLVLVRIVNSCVGVCVGCCVCRLGCFYF